MSNNYLGHGTPRPRQQIIQVASSVGLSGYSRPSQASQDGSKKDRFAGDE